MPLKKKKKKQQQRFAVVRLLSPHLLLCDNNDGYGEDDSDENGTTKNSVPLQPALKCLTIFRPPPLCRCPLVANCRSSNLLVKQSAPF